MIDLALILALHTATVAISTSHERRYKDTPSVGAAQPIPALLNEPRVTLASASMEKHQQATVEAEVSNPGDIMLSQEFVDAAWTRAVALLRDLGEDPDLLLKQAARHVSGAFGALDVTQEEWLLEADEV